MMSKKCLNCIKCNKPMENFMAHDEGQQPVGGLAFKAHGHYGSTVLDMPGPTTPKFLEISICDKCVLDLMALGLVFRSEP